MNDQKTKNQKVISLGKNKPKEMTIAALTECMDDITSKEWQPHDEIAASRPAVRVCGLEELKTKSSLVFEKKDGDVKSFPKPNT
jgi:hypothetical protein